MRIFKRWIEKAEPVDIRRRGFIFGAAAATLVVAAPKSFFVLSPPKIILPSVQPLQFDLPNQQMLLLMRRLQDKLIEVSAIPRWLVINKDAYDALVPFDHEAEARRLARIAEVREARLEWALENPE